MTRRFSLSEEQAAAVGTFGCDLGVSAGAGSGKTTVLVERYLEAVVKKGASPENILAVTFTDKAANVMKERLRRRCRERGLDEVRRGLDGAWIGTIHSFCARFLKENPIESGVDPSFTVLGAGEEEMMMENLLDRLFEEESSNEGCLRLLADHDEKTVRSSLKYFYDKARSSAGQEGLLEARPAKEPLLRASEELKGLCEKILSEFDAASNGPGERLKDSARLVLKALEGRLQGWERFEAVRSAAGSLDRRSTKTKASVSALKESAERWGAWHLQSVSADSKKEWLWLLERFTRMYEDEKRSIAAYDFEDLLCFTHRALTAASPEAKALRQRAMRQFTHIFVDEYQDTSLLQARILENLKQKDNLFVVGDVRQSIYRFRHAHPEIFADALKRSKKLTLAENYRSRPEIISALNGVFGELFGASHEPLAAKRKFKLKKEHCLERITVPKDDRSLDALRVIEARTVASRVRQLIDGGFRVEEDGKTRPASYRDFALLLRKSTSSRIFEKELEAFRIPYFVNKGRGFYEKTEVTDLVNFLRILENPAENIALAAVLRSPLVQVSDDALYWLSKKRLSGVSEAPLFTALAASGGMRELSEEDKRKLEDFLGLFERLRAQKDSLRISELLQKLLQETAYEAKSLTGEDGPQARANVLKLVEMAGRVEDKSVRGISDFILYLKSISDSPEKEAEARTVGEEEDVLRILTVHAAKGLEFPCIILGDMGAQDRSQGHPPFLCSASQGLGARLKNADGSEYQEDAAYKAILEEEERAEEAESDRLLYVALTRAKEHLILAGVSGGEATWIARVSALLDALEIPVKNIPVVTRRPSAQKKEPGLIARLPEPADEKLADRLESELLQAEKAYEALEDLTVTRILASVSPAHGKEAPENEEPEEFPYEEEEDPTPRNEYGTVFHRLMEMSLRYGPGEPWPAGPWARLTADLSADERDEMKESFEKFWKSPLGLSVKKAGKRYPELPFIYKTRHGILKGQIDLLFREAQGGWVILDYKTNRFAGAADKEAAVKKYSWQLKLYALAFWRLYGEIPKKTVLYFASTHETAEFACPRAELERLAGELEALYRAAVASHHPFGPQ